ncbi:MAG: hypothetical protein IJ356_02495 [Erysipelotrichaceae bacterium]|nr:hypothetical protein [Erysipelotrichaceae bacterium]
MNKKTIGLSAAFLLAAGASICIVPKWFEHEMSKRLDLIDVVSASNDVAPRTVITEKDIAIVRIPSAYLNDSAYVLKEDVIGKITVRNGFIPKGSFFYHSALEDVKETTDAAILDLNHDQVLVALETNMVALGANALSKGQLVDIYVTVLDSMKESKIGSLLKNVRILGIKDHKGFNMDDPESTHTPHVIQLAISQEALPLIQKAMQEGELSYYASKDAYHQKKECIIDWDSEMIEILGIEKEAIE